MYNIMDNGKVTLYLEQDNNKFNIMAFHFNKNPEKIYTVKSALAKKLPQGKTIISLEATVYEVMSTKAKEDYQNYIANNISNWSIYEPKRLDWGDGDKLEDQFLDLLLDAEDNSYKFKSFEYLDLSDISNGVLLFGYEGRYDNRYILELETFNITNRNSQESPNYLYLFYKFLSRHLAKHQYNSGTAHPVYAELMRIKEFLHEKKSIKLVLHDGTEYVIKNKYGNVSINRVFQIIDSELLISKWDIENYNGKSFSVTKVAGIKHGKNFFKINMEAFESLIPAGV